MEKEAKMAAAAEAIKKEFTNQTASGLKYIVLCEGTGNKPSATSNVKVHYTGSFLDGNIFDSSVKRGEPIDFGLNQVIPGWTEGVQLMKEGAKYKFYIPYQLAYGERGYPGAIPPKSDLIFEVELIKINN
ncbi:MAG: FKBP-type peptidyl-prolyl cis-trans isomerase [Saprospiraceae bacterium]|nr:FKBP-type peptidyl-prolyl cis-trans isomerase [Saprospiraceae bacterium]